MSRKSLLTLFVIVVSALLAVVLFAAGAIWRGRVTARPCAAGARNFRVVAELPADSKPK